MDVVGIFPKTVQGNQYVLVTMDCYSTLVRAVPTSKSTATHVADVFMDHRINPYGMQTYLLTDNGAQFVREFFALVCALLEVKHLPTSMY